VAPGPRVDRTHPRTAGNLAPCCRQHCASHFLLHQNKAHVLRLGSFHQFNRLAAWMANNERGSHLLESSGHFLNSCRCHDDYLPFEFVFKTYLSEQIFLQSVTRLIKSN
jgi:hypothetical protein